MSTAKTRGRQRKLRRESVKHLKDGIAHAAKELRVAQDELSEIDSFVFVCMVALRAKTEDDVSLGVAAVLDVAYDKLALGLNENIRNAIEALAGQDGGQ